MQAGGGRRLNAFLSDHATVHISINLGHISVSIETYLHFRLQVFAS
jgi:hypothetical protein